MNSLFIINENLTNGYVPYILDIMSIIAIICGIFVIVSKNPIVSVLFLIGLFASISFYLILIGLAFIGLSYLIVYIGAVSMLFLFILMLINIRVSELQSETSNSLPLAIIITIFFNYAIFEILPYSITKSNNLSTLNTTFYNILLNNDYNDFISLNLKNSDLFLVTSKIWDGNLGESGHITSIGNIMYANYNIWLIIASFILILAMVGAIIITIKQR